MLHFEGVSSTGSDPGETGREPGIEVETFLNPLNKRVNRFNRKIGRRLKRQVPCVNGSTG